MAVDDEPRSRQPDPPSDAPEPAPAAASSSASPASPASPEPARAKPYWRLLWLLPGLALLVAGILGYRSPGAGGLVSAIRLSTREGLAGEAADAYARIKLTTPDYYLVLHATTAPEPVRLPEKDDTPLGDGLTWGLDAPVERAAVQKVEVWDGNTLLPDDQLDHVTFAATDVWTAHGQTYQIELQGDRHHPPAWAWWVGGAGAVITLWVVVAFVKDQVV
jgi:hypothetical protein